MLQNAPNCTIQKIFSRRSMPQTPLANDWLRHASQASQKVGPLGKSCIRPWTTTEKSIRGNALVESTLAQLIVCSTLYVYALHNLFRGQKMTKIVAQHILKCITWALFSNTMCP